MKWTKVIVATFCIALSAVAFAADKLGVAEPVAKGGVPAADIEAFWDILETSIHTDEYTLITRSALKQMMVEIGLTTSSDLLKLNSAQKAKLGQLEGVKYILVSTISKFGSQLTCTVSLLESSTGEIDQERTGNFRVKNLDELADKLNPFLEEIGLTGPQKARIPWSAILSPVIKVPGAPSYLADDFNVRFEEALMDKGLKLQNLQNVTKILQDNNMRNLFELEPKEFRKVGDLLEVDLLIQAFITEFEIEVENKYSSETGANTIQRIGRIEGSIRIISAQTGENICSVPFDERINFRSLSRTTRDWNNKDYSKYLIKTVIPEKIVPAIMKSSAFKDRLGGKEEEKKSSADAKKSDALNAVKE